MQLFGHWKWGKGAKVGKVRDTGGLPAVSSPNTFNVLLLPSNICSPQQLPKSKPLYGSSKIWRIFFLQKMVQFNKRRKKEIKMLLTHACSVIRRQKILQSLVVKCRHLVSAVLKSHYPVNTRESSSEAAPPPGKPCQQRTAFLGQ